MAKRMVLVDPKTLNFNTPPPANTIPDVIPDNLHRFDEEMKNILFLKKDVSLHEKIQHYNQVLEKYLKFYKDYKNQNQPPLQERGSISFSQTHPQPPSLTKEHSSDIFYDEVIQSLSAAQRSKGRRILNYVKRIPELTWSQKGEMLLNNKLYPNSHLEDLIKGVVSPKSKSRPEGLEDFKELLKKNNIPTNLINFPQINLQDLPLTPSVIEKKHKKTPKSKRLRSRQITSWVRF